VISKVTGCLSMQTPIHHKGSMFKVKNGLVVYVATCRGLATGKSPTCYGLASGNVCNGFFSFYCAVYLKNIDEYKTAELH